MKPSVTIAMVPTISKGPWIYWDKIEVSIPKAKAAGFNAVELFPASAGAIDPNLLGRLLEEHGMTISAVGSGAGKAVHGYQLVHTDPETRAQARQFIAELIQLGAQFNAPVVIGSMQGSIEGGIAREKAFDWLREALNVLGGKAKALGMKLLYEPLNRYETNVVNSQAEGVALIRSLGTDSVFLLADLFHMNIEEVSIAETIRASKGFIGHVHLADSNRRPAGMGHTNLQEAVDALREIGYDGYVSAEALPYPNPDEAAAQTMRACRALGIA